MNPQPPSFKEAFLFWLKLGFISFGGPAGQIAIMQEFLVEKKNWISGSKFLHALNYCMLLPGPEAQQLAVYTGWLLHGVRGGLIAGLLFILPSVFILLGLSILYVLFGDLPVVFSLLAGLKPAVVAIVITALVKIGKNSLSTFFHYAIALLSFIAIWIFNVPFPLIIISAFIIALIVQKVSPSYLSARSEGLQASKEEGYYLNTNSEIAHTTYNRKRFIVQLLVGIVLWVLPFLLISVFISDREFWYGLSLFFTKAAMVTFGGAYAILPYVAQVSVEQFGWLNEFQMMDGLALGETTPGPLIMVLAFVGFMGAYNHYNFSITFGALGLFMTVWFTFLPSFLFVLLGGPVIERTQNNIRIKELLSIVSAAVVGVILHLSVYMLSAVLHDIGPPVSPHCLFSICWIIISLLALYRLKVNMMVWLGVSALAGLGFYLVFA